MATLKEIRMRLKSVTNIQKITKSMKMVSAAKYSKAERDLKSARPYGAGAQAFYERAEIKQDEGKPKHLVVALTSDRGLCGGVHSSICKTIKSDLEEKAGAETKLVLIGDKAKAQLQKGYGQNVLVSFNNIGKKPPSFLDASFLAQSIIGLDYEYDVGTLYFNRFRSVISYRTTKLPIPREQTVKEGEKLSLYDSLDDEVIQSYHEFQFASLIFFTLKEAACSEQSARMTAMEAASKNAGEMIDKLTLTFNRTRQAVITRELIEIISGAAAL